MRCAERVPEIGGGTCTTLILSWLYCPLYCSVLSEICRMNGKSNLPVISVFAFRLVVGSREWSLREYWMTQVTCSGLMRRLRPVHSHYERRRRAYYIRSTSLGVDANWRTAWATKRGATCRMYTRLHHGKSHALGEFIRYSVILAQCCLQFAHRVCCMDHSLYPKSTSRRLCCRKWETTGQHRNL